MPQNPEPFWLKAEHNVAFTSKDGMRDGEFSDWAVTALFYAAVHYVNAATARSLGKVARVHGEREQLLLQLSRNDPRDPAYRHYRELKDRATEARYGCERGAQVGLVRRLEENRLTPLREALRKHAGK